MSRTLLLLSLSAAVAGCSTTGNGGADHPLRGVEAVNVPVVSRQDYALDLNASDGSLSASDAARLDGWFRGLDLGYGDSIYVDGAYAGGAREDVARIAGRYGMLVSNGAPMTAGAVAPGAVRVVVTRTRASVPNCPNWSVPSAPTGGDETMSNFGCGVNSNLAAMVANPEDLVHGQAGAAYSDAEAGAKAVLLYRDWPLTAVIDGQTKRPLLKESDTKKKDQ